MSRIIQSALDRAVAAAQEQANIDIVKYSQAYEQIDAKNTLLERHLAAAQADTKRGSEAIELLRGQLWAILNHLPK